MRDRLGNVYSRKEAEQQRYQAKQILQVSILL